MPVSICVSNGMVQDPLTFRFIFLDDELVNKEFSECYVDYFVDVKQTVGAVVLLWLVEVEHKSNQQHTIMFVYD